jgi:ferredoxin like protein
MLSENQELDLVKLTRIKPDKKTHITIKNPDICLEKCQNKACTYFCPAKVYHWNGHQIVIEYARCLECGASVMGCPHKNIAWRYPQAGYGISHRF